MRNSEWCIGHHPDKAKDRQRRASKGGKRGGRGRPQAELSDIKWRLSDLAEDVLAGKVERGVGAVASQILNVYLRAVAVELKAREQLEITERLEELEAQMQAKPGGRRHGA
jgi:hypothetical protein